VTTVIDTGKVKMRSVVSGEEEDGGSGVAVPAAAAGGTGMESLSTVNVSQAQAIQRAGRAGELYFWV
jgi:hypothetical protein